MSNLSELSLYTNSQLEKIKSDLTTQLTSQLTEELTTKLALVIQQIYTNNHYVEYQKERNPSYSLHSCVFNHDHIGISYLLKTGANPNEKMAGKTPLHRAAILADKKAIELLKTSPIIDLSIKTTGGKTAFDLTDEESCKELLKIF